jgi:peptidoglycan/LPS O-acetylase OafA/YrhL/lysophospholipase L1-like esterase
LKRAQPNVLVEQAHATQLRYRPDIDGLRALAVLPVLFYHAFPWAVPAGFYGVDVFFVISGYLITGIIHEQMLSNTFSIADFYARRIRRIFPALIAVVLVTFAVACLILPPRDLKSLGTNIAGGAVFLQNFILLGQVGYFDLAAEDKPLLHLWSLAIEEQYYIVWPLLLLLIGAWRRRSLAITLGLAAASFVGAVMVQRHAPDYAFYLPVTRAWELLIGSGLALWINGRPSVDVAIDRRTRLVHEAIALGAMLVLAFAFWRYNRFTAHPGSRTLLPVFAAAALLATNGTLVHRYILSSAPLVFVGLISYPLYLWHYPLIVYARIHYVEGVSPWVMWEFLVASVMLAWLTYRTIERPIRFGQRHAVHKVGALLGGMVALGLAGLVLDRTNGLPDRIPESIRGFMLTGDETAVHWRRGKCLLLPDQTAADFAPECAGEGRHPLVAIWGDSYGAALYPGLQYFAADRGFDIAEFTASACPPLLDYIRPDRPACKGANDFVAGRLAELKPEVVIFYSNWGYTEGIIREGLQKTVSRLKAIGIPKIVLLGPPASWLGEGLPADLLAYYFQTHALLPERTWYRSYDDWTRPMDQFLAAQAKSLDIQYISARQIMCNDEGCLARIGENGTELTAYDGGHLTRPGAIFLARHILEKLPELGSSKSL